MVQKISMVFIFAFALAQLTSCASGYYRKAESAHNAFNRGDYEEAAKLIEKIEYPPKDKLLYLMDRGMILHAAARYEDSNKALSEAEELSDMLTAKSISREVGAVLGSEEATEYSGEKYERVMIPVLRMLNYVMLDQWDEALVEVRRIQNVAEKVFGSRGDFDNAFAVYLSAVIWEALGQINDAMIDYNRLNKQGKDLPYYGQDLKVTSQRLGIPLKFPPPGSAAWNASKDYRDRGRGQLIVMIESGRSPQFVSEAVSTGLYTISLPTVTGWSYMPHGAAVSVDGEEVGKVYAFYNIADDIMKALKERRKRSFVRKTIKLSLQTGLYAASDKLMKEDKTEEQLIGVALGILSLFMSVADKADERSWRTLPQSFDIGRFFLEPGRHEIRISGAGGIDFSESVEISPEKPKAILIRQPGGAGEARRISGVTPGLIAGASAEEARLSREVGERPGDGSAKIDLAYAKMRRGDYDVEVLLGKGLREGGNKHDGLLALVIVHMVQARYGAAADDARAGGLDDYRKVAEYMMGRNGDGAPDVDIKLTDKTDIASGFDYFVSGLIEEKRQNFSEATKLFAGAYEHGLVGEPIVKRVMDAFRRSDEGFKRSDEGLEIISKFADSYLPRVGQ